MEVIRISQAEAARDFAGLIARVRAGAEVVIENGSEAVAVLHLPLPTRRTVSESIALAEARTRDLGYKPSMDEEFVADMQKIIGNRKPGDRSAWND